MLVNQSRSLVDWLSYLARLHPVNIDLGLTRVGAVAATLGLTQLPCRVITVAGTNGKGSTCALAESVLRAAGYRVGVYSSPHLVHFTERVRIDGAQLDEAAHCAAFSAVEAARGATRLTLFEFATLAALWRFARSDLDVLLLEVGLGGRLDATNVVASNVAVITSIALDHTDWLGDTREAVAVEKAGVFRRGCVAISGEPLPPATIASEAARLGASLWQVGRDFRAKKHAAGWDYFGPVQTWRNLPEPRLPAMNALTALAALEALGLPLSQAAVAEGLAQAQLAGRMQCLQTAPAVWLDVAHNPHSAAYLAQRLQALPGTGRRLAVVGMLKDKDIAGTLAAVAPLFSAWYLADLGGERGASCAQLAADLALCAPNASPHRFTEVSSAYQQALADAAPHDLVMVFGSFHTVGEVLAHTHTTTLG
ncbi:MAG: bifunctional tetrahydrofolate synthase/dihydrofolate synthase [Aeromonas sp.]